MNFILVLSIAAGAALLHYTLQLHRNRQECKRSGIRYVVVPFFPYSLPAQVTAPIWRPLLKWLLPEALKTSWFDFLNPAMAWEELYAPFRRIGSDTVLICSPSRILLLTAGAGVINQITERRNDFPKAVEDYSVIDIYGKSAISVEGQLWRRHRKVISPPFNEKNNRAVWLESIHQAEEMLKHVFREGSSHTQIHDVSKLTSKMALAIISKAGFGIRLHWESDKEENALAPSKELNASRAHRMSYAEAIFSVAEDVFWLIALPRSLLCKLPFLGSKRAASAYEEWGQYMREMIASKRTEIQVSGEVKRDDLLASLIKGADTKDGLSSISGSSDADESKTGLSDDEIMGNAFLMVMAGYETTAGNLHMALTLLALHMESQRRLQEEIDKIFESRPTAKWSYEEDFPRALGGMLGAVMLETLRWTPPVIAIPKWAPTAQTIEVHGSICSVPAGCCIALDVPAAHRNPNQWRHRKPREPRHLEYAASNETDDLGEFSPERWLLAEIHTQCPEDGTKSATGTSPNLYRPVRGAYLPFSEGPRACAGRRFSQVEVVAILAVIFHSYSVELDTDEWCDMAALNQMSKAERRCIWDKARMQAQQKLRNNMRNMITNRLAGTNIPLCFVKRGNERFSVDRC